MVSDLAMIKKSTTIGKYCVIEADVEIGSNCTIGHHVVIKSGTVIGDNCKIDSGVHFSGGGTTIGDRVTIRNHAVICRECTIGDDVFISPKVMTIYQEFTKVGRKPKGGIHIGDGAQIGTSSVIDAGIKIGKRAKVGAMSFVNKDAAGGATVKGIPAKGKMEYYRGLK